MWKGYYYKIEDNWTPLLNWLPRWFSANSYPDIYDSVSYPNTRSALVSAVFYSPASSSLPSEWILPSATYSTSGSLYQKLFEIFVNEKEYLFPALNSAMFVSQLFFDVSEPQFAWIVESLDPVDSVKVSTASGFIDVIPAISELDLFHSANWRWKQQGSYVLIYGLDIQSLVDTVVSGWHYIDGTNRIASGSMVYMEHPNSKNWIPIHPSTLASDGFANIYYNDTVRFRGMSSRAAKLLEQVVVKVNGVDKVARRVPLYNSVDEKALLFGLTRRYGEDNKELGETILKASWFRGQNKTKSTSFISASLRQGQIFSIASSASSFSIPASSTDYSILNLHRWYYKRELLEPDVDSTNYYRSSVVSGGISCGYFEEIKTQFTSSSGLILFDTFTNNSIDRPYIDWRIDYFSANASTLFISDNYAHKPENLTVYFPSRVKIPIPSTKTYVKSFNRTSPAFKWHRDAVEAEVLTGLAVFDF
jgi:hypothetical protein